MDSFYTILLYIGAIVLIGLVKSISKAGKKKPAVVNQHTFSAVEEKKDEEFVDINSFLNFLQENSISPKIDAKPKKSRKPLLVVPVQNEQNMPIETSSDSPIFRSEKDKSFIFGEFDLPAAIVYSEILKRPNY